MKCNNGNFFFNFTRQLSYEKNIIVSVTKSYLHAKFYV